MESHRLQVEDCLIPGSPAFTLAIMSCTTAVGICEDLFQFVDDFVRKLTKSKFSHKKAFHVTSRLMRRLFVEIFAPQQGVLKSINVADPAQISSAILWSKLQSLGIASSLKSIGFENLEVVSSELVKFLLVNTGYDSITKLEAQVASLEAH